MESASLSDTLLQVRGQRESVSTLVDAGWEEVRTGLSLRLRRSWSGQGSDIADAVHKLDGCITDGSLSLARGSLELRLSYLNREFFVDAQPDIEIESSFEREERELARSALEGNSADALLLSGSWSVDIGVNFCLPLDESDPSRQWVYAESADVLTHELKSRAWWKLRPLIQCSSHVVFLVNHDSGVWFESRSFSIVGWNAKVYDLSRSHIVDEFNHRSSPTLTEIPSLEALTSRNSSSHLTRQLENQILVLGAAAAWAQLANEVRIHGNAAEIEYVGYQRASWRMDSHGPEIGAADCLEAISLASWAADRNPDKILAIRQVVSLNRSEVIWGQAREIAQATQPVFAALRSSAIAEALKSVREARGTAISISRQTSDSAIASAKGAVERTLATLAAIFGVVIARASQIIPADTEGLLRTIGGVYLFMLAAWAAFIEGPIVTAGISALKNDVSSYSDFLSTEETNKICSLDIVGRARRQAWIVRVTVPASYVAVGIVILLLFR